MAVAEITSSVPVFNFQRSVESPKSIRAVCNFASDAIFSFDLLLQKESTKFQSIRSFFFNCRNCATAVTLFCVETGQQIVIDPGTQGYLPFLVSNGMQFHISGATPDVAYFNFLNVDMPPVIIPAPPTP